MADVTEKFKFSIGEGISSGWDLTKKHYGSLVKMGLVYFGFIIGYWIISTGLTELGDNAFMGVLQVVLFLAYVFGLMFLVVNIIKQLVMMVDGKEGVGVAELFTARWRNIFSFLGFYILYYLAILLPMLLMLAVMMIAGGGAALLGIGEAGSELIAGFGIIGFVVMILLYVVMIYISLALTQGFYLVADKDMGPIHAFKSSFVITKGVKLRILGLSLLLMLLNLGGMLLFLVGLLVTIPITIFSMAWMYRQLSMRLETGEVVEAIEPEVAKKTPAKTSTTKKTEKK